MARQHARGNGHSPEPYHFFKVVFEDAIQEGKLGIPKKFARDYGNALSSRVFLKVPTGAVWEVELTKCDGKIWLENGWKNFAEHYSIEHGYFLVFRYEGSSHFHVLIFERSASEIKYPDANDVEEIQQQEVLEIEESEQDSILLIDDISTCRREKPQSPCGRPNKMMRTTPSGKTDERRSMSKRFGCDNGSSSVGKRARKSTTVCRVRQLTSYEKSEVLQRAGFDSNNPYFIVVMQSTYIGLNVGGSCLGIPSDFSRKHLKDHGDVILYNSNGKTWSAKYFSFLRNGLRYVKLRWFTFVQDNNLKIGDVCAFELINSREISFKVFIDRGQEAEFQGSRASTDVICPVKREAGSGTSSTHQGYRKPFMARGPTLQTARAFTSENPFWVVKLGASYVHKNHLFIPEHFARTHLPETLKLADVTLCLNGKSWPAVCRQQGIGRRNAIICRGWRAFVLDNNLEVGDICVLEMTKENSKISFNVFINQDIADANGHSSQGVTRKPIAMPSQSEKAAASKQASKGPIFRTVVRASGQKEKPRV